MTLRDKLNKLSPEQQKKLLAVKTTADLDAVLAELGIAASPEEKAAALEQINPMAARELSDDEAQQASGGLFPVKVERRDYSSDDPPAET